jgi:hypothetical protein
VNLVGSGVPISSGAAPFVEQPSVSTGAAVRASSPRSGYCPAFRGHRPSDETFSRARRRRSARPFGNLIAAIGITLLVFTVHHVISHTSIPGAILLTSYLGGAASSNSASGIRSSAKHCPRFIRRARVAWTVFGEAPSVRRFLCEVDLIPLQALGKKEA